MDASEIKKIASKLISMGIGSIRGNAVYAYWGAYLNFGDQLTPLLLKHYGFTPVYSSYKPSIKYVRKAEFVSVGTLLQNTPEDFSGVILGTGMDDVQKTFKKASVLGVRGYLTKKNLQITDDIVVGDPGLLVSYVYPEELQKKWDLGIVPHLFDKKDPIIETWKNRFGERARIIDVQRRPRDVIEDVKMCRSIISSSLHGLTVADTFAIPNIRFVIRRNYPERYDFKFRDYYSALGVSPELIEADGTETIDFFLSKVSVKRSNITALKEDLNTAYHNLKDHFG